VRTLRGEADRTDEIILGGEPMNFFARVWAALMGRQTPEELRALEIADLHKKAQRRTRDAADRLLGAVVVRADWRPGEYAWSRKGVSVALPVEEWLAFARDVLGEDHPVTERIRLKAALVEPLVQ
jgi:hypothetical protein